MDEEDQVDLTISSSCTQYSHWITKTGNGSLPQSLDVIIQNPIATVQQQQYQMTDADYDRLEDDDSEYGDDYYLQSQELI